MVITGRTVEIYNTNGKHVKRVGNRGKGRGEYVNAVRAYVSNSYIYVHCASTGRVNIYDLNGEYVKSYISPYIAIKFVVGEDNIFYAYSIYRRDENCFIKVYDLEKDRLIARYGEPTDADNLFASYNAQGDLSIYKDKIYYVAPSKLEVNVIEDGESRVLCRVVNSDFKVDFESKYIEKNNAFGFSVTNSTNRSVYRDGDRIYMLAQTGRYYSKDKSDEVMNIFEMSADGDPIKQTILNQSSGMMFPHSYYNGAIYYIKYIDDSEDIFLDKVEL